MPTSYKNTGVEDRNMLVKDIRMLERIEVKLNFTRDTKGSRNYGEFIRY